MTGEKRRSAHELFVGKRGRIDEPGGARTVAAQVY